MGSQLTIKYKEEKTKLPKDNCLIWENKINLEQPVNYRDFYEPCQRLTLLSVKFNCTQHDRNDISSLSKKTEAAESAEYCQVCKHQSKCWNRSESEWQLI